MRLRISTENKACKNKCQEKMLWLGKAYEFLEMRLKNKSLKIKCQGKKNALAGERVKYS
jgi:hypothetical protein